MTPLVTPTVHINGTSAQELVQQRLKVISVLQDLGCVMAEAAPHPRDYPDEQLLAPQAAYKRAVAAWNERMDGVQQLINELEMDAMKITLAACK